MARLGGRGQKIGAASFWLLLVGGVLAYMLQNDLGVRDLLRQLIALMQTPAGPLIYMLAYLVRPLLFFSALVLSLAAGALFGPVWGIIYTVIASNLSATVAYGMGRLLGADLFARAEGTEGRVAHYAGRMRENSFETTLLMRFLFLPYDLVSYLAGFLRIDYRAFILATILGSLPGTFSIVLAGASIRVEELLEEGARPALDPWTLAASALLFLASLALSRFLKRREQDPLPEG